MATAEPKKCTKCGLKKGLEAFPPDKRYPDGKALWCSLCTHNYYVSRAEAPKDVPEEKECCRCKSTKSIDEFGTDKYTKDGKATRCKDCKRQENIDFNINNPTNAAARQAKWRDNHPEEHQASVERGRKKKNTRRRELHQEQKEKDNAQSAAWHAAHPGYAGIKAQRRRMRLLGLPCTFTDEQRAFMKQYWHHACAVCGNEEGLWWTLAEDHWLPVTGPRCPGTTALNIIPLCHGDGGCNNSKHNTDPHTWLLRHYDPKKVAKIEQAIATYFAIVAATFPVDDSAAAD